MPLIPTRFEKIFTVRFTLYLVLVAQFPEYFPLYVVVITAFSHYMLWYNHSKSGFLYLILSDYI